MSEMTERMVSTQDFIRIIKELCTKHGFCDAAFNIVHEYTSIRFVPPHWDEDEQGYTWTTTEDSPVHIPVSEIQKVYDFAYQHYPTEARKAARVFREHWDVSVKEYENDKIVVHVELSADDLELNKTGMFPSDATVRRRLRAWLYDALTTDYGRVSEPLESGKLKITITPDPER